MVKDLVDVELIREFIKPEEVNELIELCKKTYQPSFDSPQSGRRILLKTEDFRFGEFDPNPTSSDNTNIMKSSKKRLSEVGKDIVQRALKENLVYLPKAESLENFINSFSPWIRFMKYDQATDCEFKVHADPILNPSAILYLTKCGLDYSGSIYIANRETLDSPIALDTYANPGDLIIFNANKYIHWVDIAEYFPSESNHNKKLGKGRITIFMALNPSAKKGGFAFKNSLFNFYAVNSIPDIIAFYLDSLKTKSKKLLKIFKIIKK